MASSNKNYTSNRNNNSTNNEYDTNNQNKYPLIPSYNNNNVSNFPNQNAFNHNNNQWDRSQLPTSRIWKGHGVYKAPGKSQKKKHKKVTIY